MINTRSLKQSVIDGFFIVLLAAVGLYAYTMVSGGQSEAKSVDLKIAENQAKIIENQELIIKSLNDDGKNFIMIDERFHRIEIEIANIKSRLESIGSK